MILFKETQRFRRMFVYVALFIINCLFVYILIRQIVFNEPFGANPVSNTGLILLSFIPLSLLVFVFSIKLETSISDDGIRYCFYPFQFKTTLIEWEELSNAYLRKYSSFYEYGGWGIRVGKVKTDRAINTSASWNVGLQLEFKDGSTLLIGTQKPDEIKKILTELSAKGKIGWKV